MATDSPGRPLGLAAALLLFAAGASGAELRVATGADLAALAAAAPPGTTLRLAPGDYHLTPTAYLDPTCGNCEDPATPVPATLGLRLTGQGLVLAGAGPDSTVIDTGAGYGILIEDCDGCALEDLALTGGVRDPDGRATDAAVVVRRSRAAVRRCTIADNIGDPAVIDSVVVGIIGVAGREGARLTVSECEIRRNSWDGIALYRGAEAEIEGNVIDGVDRARGKTAGGGRGVGIGMTWDARATVRGNLVRNYWKGIGVFVDARATVEENVVEEMLTWGMSLWDAGRGLPAAVMDGNAVYRTGACGVSVVRDSAAAEPAPGRLTGNAIVESGQDPRYDTGEPYCFQTAIARHAVPPEFAIERNFLFANREAGGAPGAVDLDEAGFRQAVAPLVERLGRWPALRRSSFLARFGPR